MKHKTIISLLLPILFITSLMVPLLTMVSQTPTVSAASSNWWNSSWTYRRAITISPLNPENFQIKVLIPSVIPTSEYPSIRFLENSNSGVLQYWIESSEGVYDNNYMNIAWVRRLENADNTIYMYYHNAGASSAENGDNVFLFFDGFVGSSVDSNKWATTEGNVSVSSNVLHLWANGKIEHGESKGLTTEEENTRRVFETRMKNATTNRGGLLISGSGWDHEETACIFQKGGGEYRFWSANFSGTQDGGYLSQQNHEGDKYYILRVDLYGNSNDKLKSHFYQGNDNSTYRTLIEESNETTHDWAPPGDRVDKYSLRAWDGSSSYYFDWIFVRKWAATEPTATVGSEESATRGVSVSILPSPNSGLTGENIVFTVKVQNTGNDNDNFDLAFGDNAGWSMGGLPANTGIVAPGDNFSGQLWVVIGGSPGDNDNVWVQATSKGDNSKKDNKSAIAHNLITGVSVSILPSSQSGANGATLSYTVTVTNNGETTDNFSLSFGDNAGWNPQINKTLLTSIGPGASDNTTIENVTIPSGAIGGTIDNVWVQATSQRDSTKKDNKSATAELTESRSVSVSISPSIQAGENGATLNYTVTVTNTGNVSDTYTLDNTDNAVWVKSLSNTSIGPLAPFGGSDNTTILSVTIPAGAIDGDEDNVTVTANGTGDSASANTIALCTIEVVLGVSVSISPSSQNGANGVTLTYTVTVTNTGNASDNYALVVTDNENWSPSVLPTSVVVPAFSSDNTTVLSVTIPSNAIGGTVDNITVTATGDVVGSASATATADIARSVSASISPSSQNGANGATLTYTVTVNNTGNVSDNFSLTPSDDAGWSPSVLPTSVVVPAFSSDNTTVLSVTIPSNAIGGTVDNITVAVNGTGDNASANCTATADIARSVSASISPSSQNGANGATLTYTVTINNTGNVSDNYALTPSDNAGWSPSVLPTSVVVPAFSSDNTTVLSVTIPLGAIGGTVDDITVTATSQADNNVKDNDSATATVTTVYGVQVSISPATQYGLQGDNLTYTVTVKNNGNVDDSYNITTGDNASPSWNPTTDNSVLAIPVSGTSTTTLRVTVGSIQIDNIWVAATSVGSPSTSDNKSVTANASWAYRRKITISPLNPENFQVKVLIPSDIPKSDYPSIRFLENKSVGVLPYWIEKNEANYINAGTDPAWVRRLENDDNTIYMYYHNASATSAENMDNVFLFSDDFGGPNSGKWTSIPESGTVSFDSTVLHIVGAGGNKPRVEGQFSGLAGQQDWRSTAKTIEFRVKNASTLRGGLLLNGSGWNQVEYACIFDSSGYKFYQDGGHYSGTIPGDKYWIGRVDMSGTVDINTTFYVGNDNADYRTQLWTAYKDKDWTNANGGDYVDKIVLAAWDSGTSSYYFDWIFMRKWVATEPVATVGPKESAFGVTVSISPSSQNGANGATLNYTVTVTNTGAVQDNYVLTVGDSAGWSPSVLPTSVVVAAGSSDNATTLSVAIPTLAIGGTTDSIWVQATSQGDNTANDNKSATAQADIARSVSVSISPGSQSGANGDTLAFTVTVNNTGNVGDTFTLENTDNSGWALSLSNTSVAVPAFSSDNTTVLNVTIPLYAIGGTTDNIRVTATCQENTYVSSFFDVFVELTVTNSVSVSISPGSQSGDNGVTLNYNVTVTNNGNVSDTYTLDNSDNSGWALSLSTTSVVVPAFSSDNTTTLSVTIPGGAINGDEDNVQVTATGTFVSDTASALAQCSISIFRSVSVSITPISENGLNNENVIYTVTVSNTGNVDDTYSLSAIDTEIWSPIVSPTSLFVAAFSSENATLSVVVPSGAIGGTIDNITVTADGTGDSASDNCTLQVTTVMSVSVSILPSSQSGANGATLNYTVTVTNTGNVSDTYTLENTDTLVWALSLSNTSVGPLSPSASDNSTTLSVTIPSLAIGGTIDNITVTATGDVVGSDSCTAEVTIAREVSVSILPSSQSGANGATLTYTVTVNNTGNVEDNFALTPSDDAGWSPSVLPTWIVVPAFSSDNSTTLSVTIPSLAIGGTVDNITVTADDLLGASDSDTCTAELTVFRAVSVSISPSSQDKYPGGTLTYTVTVNNLGNVSDTYSLTPSDDAGWSPSVLPTPLTIAAFSSDNATLSVTIPSGATIGTVDNITVTANGTGDNASDICTASAIASVTGTASIRLATGTAPLVWGIRKVKVTTSLVVTQGDNLKLVFLANDNTTVESQAVIWSRTAPGAQVVNLTNLVSHDNALSVNVHRVKLVLTDSAGNVILDNMAWYKAVQDDWGNRITWIVLNWSAHNSSQQDQLGNEITQIVLGWSGVPTTRDQHDFSA